MPGALELVAACNDAGVPTALVTMSYRNFAGAIVEAHAARAVRRHRHRRRGRERQAAPEPYLDRSCRRSASTRRGCVAIEDSPTGAASAQAAGCRVVVVPNHVEVPHHRADMVTPAQPFRCDA